MSGCAITSFMEQASSRVNIVLDAEHAEKLRLLADRIHVAPGTLARALLTSAIEDADPSPRSVTALLNAIPGAFESVQRGMADYEAGNYVKLEDF